MRKMCGCDAPPFHPVWDGALIGRAGYMLVRHEADERRAVVFAAQVCTGLPRGARLGDGRVRGRESDQEDLRSSSRPGSHREWRAGRLYHHLRVPVPETAAAIRGSVRDRRLRQRPGAAAFICWNCPGLGSLFTDPARCSLQTAHGSRLTGWAADPAIPKMAEAPF